MKVKLKLNRVLNIVNIILLLIATNLYSFAIVRNINATKDPFDFIENDLSVQSEAQSTNGDTCNNLATLIQFEGNELPEELTTVGSPEFSTLDFQNGVAVLSITDDYTGESNYSGLGYQPISGNFEFSIDLNFSANGTQNFNPDNPGAGVLHTMELVVWDGEMVHRPRIEIRSGPTEYKIRFYTFVPSDERPLLTPRIYSDYYIIENSEFTQPITLTIEKEGDIFSAYFGKGKHQMVGQVQYPNVENIRFSPRFSMWTNSKGFGTATSFIDNFEIRCLSKENRALTFCKSDLDDSGDVDIKDFTEFVREYNSTCI